MTWEASYNVVAPKWERLDIVGWVTMDNQTGRDFVDAKIKLMAGDVNKLAPQDEVMKFKAFTGDWSMREERASQVTEKAFDEYHLYTLERR